MSDDRPRRLGLGSTDYMMPSFRPKRHYRPPVAKPITPADVARKAKRKAQRAARKITRSKP